jgi:hypothetical protein
VHGSAAGLQPDGAHTGFHFPRKAPLHWYVLSGASIAGLGIHAELFM